MRKTVYTKRTHCRRGHELTDKIVRFEKIVRNGKEYQARRCKQCALLSVQAYWKRRGRGYNLRKVAQ